MTRERVHFRLILMPCCNFQACWVNPRLPSYCPECGARVYPAVRSHVLVSDDNASLGYSADIETAHARVAQITEQRHV